MSHRFPKLIAGTEFNATGAHQAKRTKLLKTTLSYDKGFGNDLEAPQPESVVFMVGKVLRSAGKKRCVSAGTCDAATHSQKIDIVKSRRGGSLLSKAGHFAVNDRVTDSERLPASASGVVAAEHDHPSGLGNADSPLQST